MIQSTAARQCGAWRNRRSGSAVVRGFRNRRPWFLASRSNNSFEPRPHHCLGVCGYSQRPGSIRVLGRSGRFRPAMNPQNIAFAAHSAEPPIAATTLYAPSASQVTSHQLIFIQPPSNSVERAGADLRLDTRSRASFLSPRPICRRLLRIPLHSIACNLTIHWSRNPFGVRLNSGVRSAIDHRN